MPINEKEINCHLFDQLTLVERIERVLKRGDLDAALEELEFERKQIERKLYQQPPLIKNNQVLYIHKRNDHMPINEKEYNGILFDQLSLLENIERIAKKTGAQEVLDEIAYQRRQIERKLYQQPLLVNE